MAHKDPNSDAIPPAYFTGAGGVPSALTIVEADVAAPTIAGSVITIPNKLSVENNMRYNDVNWTVLGTGSAIATYTESITNPSATREMVVDYFWTHSSFSNFVAAVWNNRSVQATITIDGSTKNFGGGYNDSMFSFGGIVDTQSSFGGFKHTERIAAGATTTMVVALTVLFNNDGSGIATCENQQMQMIGRVL